MKIALCLSGLATGRQNVRDVSRSNPTFNWKDANQSIYDHIIKLYDTDVFIHTWTNDDMNQILDFYKPKLHLVEEPKNLNPFHDTDTTAAHRDNYQAYMSENLSPMIYAHPRVFSCWYTVYHADKLRQIYEQNYKVKYDFVIKCRFDLIFLKDLLLNTFDPKKIYIGKWWGQAPIGLEDLFWVSGPEVMTKAASLYEQIYLYYTGPEYENYIRGKGLGAFHYTSNHEIMRFHFQQTGILDKREEVFERDVNWTQNRGKDFNFYTTGIDK